MQDIDQKRQSSDQKKTKKMEVIIKKMEFIVKEKRKLSIKNKHRSHNPKNIQVID